MRNIICYANEPSHGSIDLWFHLIIDFLVKQFVSGGLPSFHMPFELMLSHHTKK